VVLFMPGQGPPRFTSRLFGIAEAILEPELERSVW
jgi:hypothetical protein